MNIRYIGSGLRMAPECVPDNPFLKVFPGVMPQDPLPIVVLHTPTWHIAPLIYYIHHFASPPRPPLPKCLDETLEYYLSGQSKLHFFFVEPLQNACGCTDCSCHYLFDSLFVMSNGTLLPVKARVSVNYHLLSKDYFILLMWILNR